VFEGAGLAWIAKLDWFCQEASH